MLKFKRTSSSCHDNLSGCMNDSNNNHNNNTITSKNTIHEVNDVKTAGGHFKEDDDVFAIKNKKGMFRLTYFTEEATGAVLKKVVLKNFAKFTGKNLHHSLFFNKVADLSLAQVFCCRFCKIFKNIFLVEHLWWLLLILAGN